MHNRTEKIPLGAHPPRDIAAAGSTTAATAGATTDPRAERRHDRRSVLARHADPHKDDDGFTAPRRRRHLFDLEDIDRDRGAGYSEELRQGGGEICPCRDCV